MRIKIKYLVRLGERKYNNEHIMKTTRKTLGKDIKNFKKTMESLAWNNVQGDEDYEITILSITKIDEK